jgi:hypothetical protein
MDGQIKAGKMPRPAPDKAIAELQRLDAELALVGPASRAATSAARILGWVPADEHVLKEDAGLRRTAQAVWAAVTLADLHALQERREGLTIDELEVEHRSVVAFPSGMLLFALAYLFQVGNASRSSCK